MARFKPAEVVAPTKPPPDTEAGDLFFFPTTIAQQGFWFLDRLHPGNPAYNIAVRFRLQGPLHVPTLHNAFNEIVRRHEPLRTSFAEVDGEPMQVISPCGAIELPVIDLRGFPAARRAEEADRLSSEEAGKRFDLSISPLIRAVLLQLGDREHMLLVTVHHIVSDGWSIGVISNELGALYEAFSQNMDSPLDGLPIQYADFALWQQEWLHPRNPGLAGQLAFWKRQLAGLAQLEIPTDRPRAATQTYNGMIDSVLLPRDLTDGLRDFSNRHGSTMFMSCLAILQVLLQRYSGQTDICVGSLVAGRNRVETEPLIGLFVNPIVLRTDLSGDPSFPDLVGRVRETVLGAMANQDLPFQRLVEALHPKRDPSRHPVFQVNFIYQRDFVRPVEFSGLTLTAVPSRSPGAIYDLNFFMVERADGWRASCEYNTDLFEAPTIQRMLQQFQALVEAVVSDPAQPISSLPLLNAEARRRVLTLPPLANPGDPAPAGPDSHLTHVSPRDETEARLVKICEKLLGVQGISVTADFFDLGGHSLMAARLLTQVGRAFGKMPSLAEFLETPTVERLASRIRDTSSAKPPLAIMINPNGSKPPLIVLGGPEFRPLARSLGPDQPVLGLPIPPVVDLPSPFRVEDFVAGLVDRLFQVRPRGPYLLAAWCNSGMFAYEMAQLLRRKGQPVPLLILFDTVNTHYAYSFQPARFHVVSQRLRHHWREMRQLPATEMLSYMGSLFSSTLTRWQRKVWRHLYRLRPNQAPVPAVAINRRLGREAEVDLALERYPFQPYSGPIMLFRTPLQTGRYQDPSLGWEDFAEGGLRVKEIPAGHQSLLREPAVDEVAACLQARLAQLAKQ